MYQRIQALWMQTHRGDALAFEALYNAHFSRVRSLLRVYSGDSSLGEDVAKYLLCSFGRGPMAITPPAPA